MGHRRLARSPRSYRVLGSVWLAVLALALPGLPSKATAAAQSPGQPAEPQLGELAWRFATDGPVRATPMPWNDRLIVASTDGHVYGVAAADGREIWRLDVGSPIAQAQHALLRRG
ncbi:MAG: PQQ-binding-like beta-propeller repeat protein [Acidobacteria bacterium]|nr:PQQ-binding-like beta-propeller repeat protein [Acidobacteriota bacterium]